MNSEFKKLTYPQQIALRTVVLECIDTGTVCSLYMADGGQAYAYQRENGAIAWGYNSGETGICIARGIIEDNGE